MAKDSALHLEGFLPAAGAQNVVGVLDLGVDVSAFSDQWRNGRLRATIPALPNATNNAVNITLTLQDSADGGVTFANTAPKITVVLPGIAANGIPAQTVDIPLPPGLRGPIQLLQDVAAGAGDNTAGLVQYDWLNE